MAVQAGHVRPAGFAATERTDAWWVAPLVQGLMLGTLICYANWAAYQGEYYEVGNYLSPLYSPLIIIPGLPFSPAFLILLPPVLFRATCYYYRKAYYRSYFLDPPGLRGLGAEQGEGVPRRDGLPVRAAEPPSLRVLRDAPLPAVPLARLLSRHPLRRLVRHRRRDARDPRQRDGADALQLLLPLRAAPRRREPRLLLVQRGQPARHAAWKAASVLNERHMLFAWTSFVTVCGADLYVRLVAMGTITDLRLL
jgi:hypothetical protein